VFDEELDYALTDEKPPSLKEWTKKELRREVKDLRQARDKLRAEMSAEQDRARTLRDYAVATKRHEDIVTRLDTIFNEGHWRAFDLEMTVEPSPPVDITPMSSPYFQYASRPDTGVITVRMNPCPPLPKEITP
jgi:hypothetical protein